ncbi:LysM peptidoglycan-binding domain-containing protein [Rossellomorea aquimaris]|uniref:LysM peptidoglycan-binding and 3D domain-containing protein n=1 Tax=Rossellomorea aquimaris TaxID=189382 RepID=UPI001CD44412|nr:3D domain-containing protein [Rossellomorea aquimaris]MCA1053818.1 LysM peptidoglycan-binding domain-containing protein [Rossellomorea aquimaris]
MKLKKSIISVAAFTTLAVSGGASASAQDIEVKKGDTLWGLAKEYGTSVDQLKKWNNLGSDLIFPDQELKVSSKEYYTVKKGDTLWGISSHYGISVDSLQGWNALESDLIIPGQELLINLDDKGTSAPVNTSDQGEAETTTAPEEAPEVAPEAEATEAKTADAAPQQEEAVSKELTVEATAYTAECDGCSGVTATGVNLKENPDAKVIAVDPDVIPLGSKVYVEGYGYATAEDTGSAIQGNRIDVFIPSKDQATDWGRKTVNVKIIETK